MIKSVKVKKSGNIGFTMPDADETVVTVTVDAAPGARISVDTDLITVTGEPFSRVGTDGVERVYVKGVAKPGALKYEELAVVSGKAPRQWHSASAVVTEDEV